MTLEQSSRPEEYGCCLSGSHFSDISWLGAAEGIRGQAAEIIETVLAGSAPEQARFRDLLRGRLAAHPGHPETALMEHLISLRSLTGFPSIVSDVVPVGDPPGEPETSVRSRIETVLAGRLLQTAFQPIHSLSTGAVIGAGALTRFVSDGADTAGDWFTAAGRESLLCDIEFAALESALAAALQIPDQLYVALKLSPATCLDPQLSGFLEQFPRLLGRMVLELTEALTGEECDALGRALEPLREQGVRLALDHAGSYAGSMRHISHLRPDIIKMDRNLIAGIDTDALRQALGEAVAVCAEQIGAEVTAQGIETSDELAAVTLLGVSAGQGYLLGRPTTRPGDWANWIHPHVRLGFRSGPGRIGTAGKTRSPRDR